MAKRKQPARRTGAVRKPDKGKPKVSQTRKPKAGSSPATPTKKSARAERDRRYRDKHRAERQATQAAQKRKRRRSERIIREQVREQAVDRGNLSDWQRAAKRMREIARETLGIDIGLGVDLLAASAPGKAQRGTPWGLRADFKFSTQIDYSALHELAKAWRDDPGLERLIGINRYARMGVKYHGPVERGSTRLVSRKWVASEIAPWDACSSRLATQTDDGIPGSVAVRYQSTTVSELSLWISHSEGEKVPF